MNTLSRSLTGTLLILLGFILLGISFYAPGLLLYAIPITIVGIFIFLNTKEDEIEQIKRR